MASGDSGDGGCWESPHVMAGEEGVREVMASGNTGAGGCWEGNHEMVGE